MYEVLVFMNGKIHSNLDYTSFLGSRFIHHFMVKTHEGHIKRDTNWSRKLIILNNKHNSLQGMQTTMITQFWITYHSEDMILNRFTAWQYGYRRSQWTRGLMQEMSSPA